MKALADLAVYENDDEEVERVHRPAELGRDERVALVGCEPPASGPGLAPTE
jgi:hypothetical protein